MKGDALTEHLQRVCNTVDRLLDRDLFQWLDGTEIPADVDRERAATVVADRLCGALSDPIIRNAQERRQLDLIENYIIARGYSKKSHRSDLPLKDMPPGTYSFRMNVIVRGESGQSVNIPIDAAIMPHNPTPSGYPVLIEAKSAGDFTNPNKRRKEEGQKINQLRRTYGDEIELVLFLCGYFDGGYLAYEAMERIDWIWEHRISDMEQLGI